MKIINLQKSGSSWFLMDKPKELPVSESFYRACR